MEPPGEGSPPTQTPYRIPPLQRASSSGISGTQDTPLTTARNRSRPSIRHTPSSPALGTSSATRLAPRSDAQKLESFFQFISGLGWSIPALLKRIFQTHVEVNGETVPVVRTPAHQNRLDSMLSGGTKPHVAELFEYVWQNAQVTKFRKDDNTVEPGESMFVSNLPPAEIMNAEPAIVTWATRLVAEQVNREAKRMTKTETGLHMTASAKEGSRGEAHKVTWDAVNTFRLSDLQSIAERYAPIMSQVLRSYSNAKEPNMPARVAVVRKYRPQNLVTTNAIMSATFGRSGWANLYPMCRGIWLFAIKAPSTLFRVESRLGLTVSQRTTYDALKEMSKGKNAWIRNELACGQHFTVVFDNIQTYARERTQGIGKESRMITGLAATAVMLEDYHPDAFNLQAFVERQMLQERRQLTAQMILEDIDVDHLDRVVMIHFLQALITFVPSLSSYKKDIDELTSTIAKAQITKTRRTKIAPLATNSADEMHVQGLKAGVLDFVSVQMGVTKETLNNTLHIFSGDGKTFNMLHLLKKLHAAEEDDFNSFRWMVPLLELWHTKWTDMSRIVRTHWGSNDAPNSLATVARLAEYRTPPDMRKVDFYEGSHLINLTLDAHLLNCWE